MFFYQDLLGKNDCMTNIELFHITKKVPIIICITILL